MSDPKKSRVSMMLSGQLENISSTMTESNKKSTSRVRMRRQSFGFSGVGGIGRVAERSSMFAPEFKRPALIYLNTYQLEPLVKFHSPSVNKAAERILDELFGDHKYSQHESPKTALRISGELMKAVKAMGFNRYRIISVVTIAQKRAQSYNNAISFLWDHERDNYINTSRETPTAFVQVTLFVVYLD
ncbi:unnamed protein product [Arctia plantaginis]|uniref:Uncharacterized protein n=1 Tax=Arctia plantaginis TaxID=874455 RepID=A0A8S0ZMX9_ARCPL|nr:unnamed protein product [Arctia plantaginis]